MTNSQDRGAGAAVSKPRPELRAVKAEGSPAGSGPAPAADLPAEPAPAPLPAALSAAAAVSPETLAARRAARQARKAARQAATEAATQDAATEAATQETAAQTGEAMPAAGPEAAPIGRGARRKARLARQARKAQKTSYALPTSETTDPTHGAPTPAEAPDVRPAQVQTRHYLLAASFCAVVLLPLLVSIFYLYTRADDQYHSEVAFSIRSEDSSSSATGLLGALTQIGSGSASDTDILFEFIRSQKIVEEINQDLDLRAIYNREPSDFIFTLGDDPSIEALHQHWLDMVDVSLGSAGIVEITARAFTAEDARAIAEAILVHSSALVNRLSEQARADAIRFASEEQAEAEANLKNVRQRLSDFRREHRLVDPSADVAGQMGLLNALQGQLAQALVDRDMLLSYAESGDQRVLQANRLIDAITARIDQERGSLDVEGLGGSLPDVVGAYEELRVDLEFANAAYTQTLAGLAGARAEARRQSRYLAPHIQPTLAESALYPRRAQTAGLIGLFLLLGWGILMLIYYNVRDNR